MKGIKLLLRGGDAGSGVFCSFYLIAPLLALFGLGAARLTRKKRAR